MSIDALDTTTPSVVDIAGNETMGVPAAATYATAAAMAVPNAVPDLKEWSSTPSDLVQRLEHDHGRSIDIDNHGRSIDSSSGMDSSSMVPHGLIPSSINNRWCSSKIKSIDWIAPTMAVPNAVPDLMASSSWIFGDVPEALELNVLYKSKAMGLDDTDKG